MTIQCVIGIILISVCLICVSTEAAGIVWTAQIQFHTIQIDINFLIHYTKCIY
jgi:hypothetical protein